MWILHSFFTRECRCAFTLSCRQWQPPAVFQNHVRSGKIGFSPGLCNLEGCVISSTIASTHAVHATKRNRLRSTSAQSEREIAFGKIAVLRVRSSQALSSVAETAHARTSGRHAPNPQKSRICSSSAACRFHARFGCDEDVLILENRNPFISQATSEDHIHRAQYQAKNCKHLHGVEPDLRCQAQSEHEVRQRLASVLCPLRYRQGALAALVPRIPH